MTIFKGGFSVSLHLRTAVDKLKDHYIQHLIKTGLSKESENELRKLTLTELKNLINGY
nr:Fur-regulated basic protein FbpA [Bacillus sp. ISL-35]